MTLSLASSFKPWNPQTDQEFETGACGHKSCGANYNTIDTYEGFTIWHCSHGLWFLAPEPKSYATDLSANHSADACPGNCKLHPLLSGSVLQMDRLIGTVPNGSWGDLAEEEFAARRAAETPQQTAARLRAEAAAEVKSHANLVDYSVHRKEDKWTKGGQMKFRVPRPCKYAALFAKHACASCERVLPPGQDTCSNGHLPEKLAGCWNHAKTRTCIYVHPDEEQWSAACDGSLCYDRTRQCFHLRGESLPSATPVAVAANRFESLVRQEREAGPKQSSAGGWTTVGSSAPKHSPMAMAAPVPVPAKVARKKRVDNSAW